MLSISSPECARSSMGTEATDFITHPVPVGSYGVGSEVPLCKTHSLYSKAASFLYWHFKKIQQYLKKKQQSFSFDAKSASEFWAFPY